jgi:hypothetical protein
LGRLFGHRLQLGHHPKAIWMTLRWGKVPTKSRLPRTLGARRAIREPVEAKATSKVWIDQPVRINRFGLYFLFFGVEKQRYATDYLTEKVAIAIDLLDMLYFFYVFQYQHLHSYWVDVYYISFHRMAIEKNTKPRRVRNLEGSVIKGTSAMKGKSVPKDHSWDKNIFQITNVIL